MRSCRQSWWHWMRQLNYLLIFLFILIDIRTTSAQKEEDVDLHLHFHQREKRSNIPCGASFTPCDRRATTFGVATNRLISDDAVVGEHLLQQVDNHQGQKIDLKRLINEKMIISAAEEAQIEVNQLYNITERQILQRGIVNDNVAARFLSELMKQDKYSKELSFSALVSIATTQRLQIIGLTSAQVVNGLSKMSIADTAISAVCPINLIEDCIAGKYRTYSGHCNNVQSPLRGAVNEPMQRLLPASYADGVTLPRSALSGQPLPNARLISSKLFGPSQTGHKVCSMMLAQWAQFILNDMVHIVSTHAFIDARPIALPCCSESIDHSECFPISVPDNDPFYSGTVTCLPYARSSVAPRENCSMGQREQANLATSFLDASSVYGYLITQTNPSRGGDLPPPIDSSSDSRCGTGSNNHQCLLTGTDNANFLPTLAALHTLWVRQHNNIASRLKIVNGHWDEERLFQETRRIVTAQIQHITFAEYLPIVIGKENLKTLGLTLQSHAYDSGYDMTADATILNEFATAAGLFFYALFPDTISQYSENGEQTQERPISSFFMDPSILYLRGKMDGILRFLLQEPIRKPGLHMSAEFRDRFLRGSANRGLDKAALIIQMGRDHGIPSYTAFREYCGLNKPSSFEALRDIVLDSVDPQQLAELYESLNDVDLFVLGLAEKPLPGGLVGPTFACIIGRQFQRVSQDDSLKIAFTEDQLNELRKTSLARIVCDNTDNIGKIQMNVFALADNFGNCPIDCNTSIIEKLDLTPWLDMEPKLSLPITRQTLEKAVRLGVEQSRRLQEAESRQIARQGSAGTASSASVSALLTHSLLMAPKKESLDIARTAAILRETTRVLLRGDGLEESERLPAELDTITLQRLLPEVDVSRIVGNISNFLGPETPTKDECLPQPLPCDHTSKYRTFSGWCNNLRFPSYGNAFGPLRRLLDPAYDDGFDSPRSRSHSGRSLPSARTISNAVHNDVTEFHVKFTHMLMQYGQILDHDMTHSPIARGPGNAILNCSRCDSYETLSIHCFPIPIEHGDPHFPSTHSNGEPRCMPFARSLLGQLTLGYRNQLNQLTSYLDASYIYGSTECEANALRLFNQGRLNFTDLGFNREALPQGTQERDCRSRPRHPCFNAGDERSNEQPGLTALHTVLLREHNRIATTLGRINNFWSDEKLFQETRRIMLAKLQHITYGEWLPIVLGCETMARYDLMPKKTGYYKGYDSHCDASITQELATSAFRFGHTLIRSKFPRMAGDFHNETQAIDLSVSFNNASAMYDAAGGHMESLLMGLLGGESMNFDRHIVSAVRNHLFQKPGGPLTGLDLPAINIQRARDHGVPGYNAYREKCGLRKARAFEDLSDVMDESAVQALNSVYEHVDDVDLFPGLMSERPLKGAVVGPSLACIIAEQFQRLKRCDRFYYENDDPAVRFPPDQLAEIRKSTMSKLICQNSQYARRIQPNAFTMPDDLTNSPMKCTDLPDTDLYEWLDRQFCVVDHRVINLGKTKRITPCITCTCTAEGPQCHSIVVKQCVSLLNDYVFADIVQDTVCVIQCSGLIRQRRGRL